MEPSNLSDVRKKVEIVKCILSKCQKQEQNNLAFNSLYGTVMYYTAESTQHIMIVLASKKRIDFKERNSKNVIRKTEGAIEVSVKHMHDMLYAHYVESRNLLMLSDVTNYFTDKFGILTGCEYILKENGFIWRKVPNTTKCLLIENPEHQARRIEYLLKIAEHREEKKPFIYVEGKVLPTTPKKTTHGDKMERVVLAASPHMGLIDLRFLNPDTPIDQWLEDEVYPHLNSNTVLVYEEDPKDFSIEPPKPESTKKEMMEWLKRNMVVHHPQMRRAELYKLIQIYCKNEKKCPRDEILKSKGVVVLRRPRDWPELNYFNAMWRRVDLLNLWKLSISCAKSIGKKKLIKDQFQGMVNMFTVSDDWQKFHNQLTVEENIIFQRDMELEEVIDKLLNMAKHEDLNEITLSDSSEIEDVFDKYDCIITDKWKEDNDDELLEAFLDD